MAGSETLHHHRTRRVAIIYRVGNRYQRRDRNRDPLRHSFPARTPRRRAGRARCLRHHPPLPARAPRPRRPESWDLGLLGPSHALPTPMSMKFTPAKTTSTSASPGPARGSGRSTYFSTSRPPVPVITTALITCSFIERSFLNFPKKGLLQCPQGHVGQTGQSRTAAPPRPATRMPAMLAIRNLRGRFRVEAAGHIAFTLRIANARCDGSSQAFRQHSIDLLEVRSGTRRTHRSSQRQDMDDRLFSPPGAASPRYHRWRAVHFEGVDMGSAFAHSHSGARRRNKSCHLSPKAA